jgi:hypothetical protein
MPSSNPITLPNGTATSLRASRCPSLTSTWVTRPVAGSTRRPRSCPMSPSLAWTCSPPCSSTSPGGMTSTVSLSGIRGIAPPSVIGPPVPRQPAGSS